MPSFDSFVREENEFTCMWCEHVFSLLLEDNGICPEKTLGKDSLGLLSDVLPKDIQLTCSDSISKELLDGLVEREIVDTPDIDTYRWVVRILNEEGGTDLYVTSLKKISGNNFALIHERIV